MKKMIAAPTNQSIKGLLQQARITLKKTADLEFKLNVRGFIFQLSQLAGRDNLLLPENTVLACQVPTDGWLDQFNDEGLMPVIVDHLGDPTDDNTHRALRLLNSLFAPSNMEKHMHC